MQDRTEKARKKPIKQFATTEISQPAMLPPIGEADESPRGLGRSANKPLMKKRTADTPLPTGNTGGNTLTNQQKKESGSVRLVLDFWASEGVPRPFTELRFHRDRKWRFDFAWPDLAFLCGGVYLEVQGGLFTQGRHTRGPALLKEYEKINAATELHWRPLFCTPKELLTVALTRRIKRALRL